VAVVREHPLEVIVIILTPPFLFAALQPVRALRLVRLLRLLRLAPLVRRLFTRQGLRYTAGLALLTALAGGAAFHQVERDQSFAAGLYWAVTTMTTVGYGDLSPHSTAGKFVAVAVMLVGIGFVALLTGAVAEAFIRPRAQSADRREAGAIEATEEHVLVQLREISTRIAEIERTLERKARPPQ
jgi:voltage-gated potassium channel